MTATRHRRDAAALQLWKASLTTSPDNPARLVQFRVSVGLLTDGSSFLPAFPGISPVACSRGTGRLQLRGQFRFAGKPRRIPCYFLTETDTPFVTNGMLADKGLR